ncbi:Lysosome-associated membrane glycoprotein 1 [Ancistrocladus abbreviatus]
MSKITLFSEIIPKPKSMVKKFTLATFAVITSLSFLYSTFPSKSSYHSFYLSPSLSSNSSIADHLYILTHRPHVAGTAANAETAAYVLSTLNSYNIPSHLTPYDVLLTYPISRALTLQRPPPDEPITFDLRQEVYDGDPYADVADQVFPTFHGYARSGTAVGPVTYVNYGRVEDYEKLKEIGVNVTGAIVLARYGMIYRGDIVQNAFERGAVGVVIYTDRKDYGGGGGGAKWFPEGKWMPPSGVQVGSVYNGIGDPTTPGWPSTGECERLSNEEVDETGNLPMIPSLPVSWADGEVIMRSIGGPRASDDWQGSEDGPVYRVGPGPGILNLNYKGNRTIARIENVIGMVEGAVEPDRFVILGNHRDAWTFGAVDPNSGTATLLEIARQLGELQKKGWKPRRSIVFCNWDAEEYGLIGSTEWVEENREMLASRAVAYLNVDCAVSGPGFYASATPQLDELLKQASLQMKDPDNSSQSLYDSWVGSSESAPIGRLGGKGSDFAAFVQHVGIPAVDMYFGGGYPVYHSMYDDFVWMKEFGDPMFQRHVAVAGMWSFVALQLADQEFLPFDYLPYAHELEKSIKELENVTSGKAINLTPLYKSTEKLKEAAIGANGQRKALKESKRWASMWEKDAWEVRELNDRLMLTERAFADPDGLSERTWYKHLIYGPSKHNAYGSKSFPGIDDAIENAKSLNTVESWRDVQHEVWRVSRAITRASLVLNGKLT